ncbi:transposase, partial [Streptosporangium subroseum]|uniref:transposase n=1 Tax=Streptosporangium subroseum TaxID=106412 RepID=UPI003416581C
IITAHLELGAPIVLVWDNLSLHLVAGMRAFAQENASWLTVFQLPAYAPDLNPAEGIWSNLRTKVFNFAVGGIDELTGLIKNRLKPMQYRPDLLNGFIAETGLVISDPA